MDIIHCGDGEMGEELVLDIAICLQTDIGSSPDGPISQEFLTDPAGIRLCVKPLPAGHVALHETMFTRCSANAAAIAAAHNEWLEKMRAVTFFDVVPT